MGLDNGVIIKSNKRELTRDMLPSLIKYPFNDNDTEIVYWRKNWSMRDKVVNTFPPEDKSEYNYIIDTPKQVFKLIKIIVSFMNKETWNNSASIWGYEEMLPILQRDVINLAIIAAYMQNNPDVYLEFYDSY